MNDVDVKAALIRVADSVVGPPDGISRVTRGIHARRKRRRAAALAVCGAATLTIGASVTLPGLLGGDSDAPNASTSQAPSQPSTAISESPKSATPVSVKKLRSFGVEAIPSTALTAVTRDQAITRAVGPGGNPVIDGFTPSAELFEVTTLTSGIELEPDPTKPSNVKPDFENVLMWVVTFPPYTAPLDGHGPVPKPGDVPDTTEHTSTSIAFVDATTGEVAFSMTI